MFLVFVWVGILNFGMLILIMWMLLIWCGSICKGMFEVVGIYRLVMMIVLNWVGFVIW